MAPETLDTIVDFLANGDFCAQNGDERCPAAVDGVIRQISSDFLLSKDKFHINIIIEYHVLREHVRDDGFFNAEHFTDHDVPARNGEPGYF